MHFLTFYQGLSFYSVIDVDPILILQDGNNYLHIVTKNKFSLM